MEKELDDLLLIPPSCIFHHADCRFEMLQLRGIINRFVLDDTDIAETFHIQRLPLGKKLFEVLLPRRIAVREEAGPFALFRKRSRKFSRLLFTAAEVGLKTEVLKVFYRNVRKGGQVKLLAELRKEDIPVLSEDTGHKT